MRQLILALGSDASIRHTKELAAAGRADEAGDISDYHDYLMALLRDHVGVIGDAIYEPLRRLGLPLANAEPDDRRFTRYAMAVLVALDIAGRGPDARPRHAASYNDTFKPVKDYFVTRGEDQRVDRIRPGNIRRYLTWRRLNRRDGKDPLSNRTLAKDRAVLHAIFEYALDAEYCQTNPVARVKPPKWDDREYVILRRDEDVVCKQYENLITECGKASPMLGLYALLLGETGVRCESEALHIRWDDIDLTGDPPAIWITGRREGHRSKSGKGRWVPVTTRLEAALKEHMAQYRFNAARSPYVFHHEHTRRHAKRGERVKSFRRAFDNAADRAKLPDNFVRHDLRHTRCTWWLEDGIDISTVQMAMGHSDVKVTQRYTHLTRRNLRKMRRWRTWRARSWPPCGRRGRLTSRAPGGAVLAPGGSVYPQISSPRRAGRLWKTL